MLDIQRKNYRAHVKALPAEGAADGTSAGEGLIEAIVSVFSNLDSQKEVVTPGAFTKSLSQRMPKGVWGHDWSQPVARTEEARELFPGDPLLPDALKELGGLYIKGRFNLQTQRGREAFSDIAFGIVDEFSIGYRVLRARRITDEGEEQEDPDSPAAFFGFGKGVRYLDELDLFEWSPVLVGANPATALLGVKTDAPLADLLTHSKAQMAAVLDEAKALHARRAKEGRTFSGANIAALEGYATDAETIAGGIRSLLATATRPERATEDDADTGKTVLPLDGQALFLEFQRTLARLQGVAA